MEFRQIDAVNVPMELLLEADPSVQAIQKYLIKSWCFVAQQNENIVGACIAKNNQSGTCEIYNVSVHPNHQGQGVGSKLMQYALNELFAQGIERIELGTGTFGYQLMFYQRLGFRVDRVDKDYFLIHYPEPIFEMGIQHKDMLRLYIDSP
ncbi:GNAT family N-acetyltransferase [Vibrio maerlii]|uniref:GNAT family N-acetyltransferase n=1 Tax=Vibrio maerlii TaxID=2231648 RepID=UPI000E3C9684|nr:GNAT family N-acetyltransferase [Vibrio maerlii]